MEPWLLAPANASSPHAHGREARDALERARATTARLLGAAHPDEVVFTSGGTESNHLALQGAARAAARGGVITEASEHPSVLRAVERLAREGFAVRVLPVRTDGVLERETLRAALEPGTTVVSVMHANNETGVIQPIAELVALVRAAAPACLFHVDAVQTQATLGSLGFPDLVSFTAHKFRGPVGIGGLYVRRGVALAPLLEGGHQETDRRAGTEPVALAVGLARALELARARDHASLLASRDALEAALLARVPGALVNGAGAPRLPGHLNVSFEGASGDAIVTALDAAGISVSAGSACSTGERGPSHVLLAMGRRRSVAGGSVRFSLGESLAREELERVVRETIDAVRHARTVAGHGDATR
jgi:cysteine desulfurase